jgi:ubiquitin carboxyl-terminal hydrolase 5/13
VQKSEGGLYVDMSSFLGFGREQLEWNYEKTGNPVYLHILQRRKPEADEVDRPLKKPTLLAIGICFTLLEGRPPPLLNSTFQIVPCFGKLRYQPL